MSLPFPFPQDKTTPPANTSKWWPTGWFKFYYYLLVSLLLYPGLLQAQTYEGDISLTSQAEVDAFNYSEVTGDLSITGYTNTISNLHSLASLKKVGSLYIGNTALSSLTGLENLTTIEKDLIIRYHEQLEDLKGLKNLVSVGGRLELNANTHLTTLAGLENLSSLGELNISFSYLTNLAGLEKLTSLKRLDLNNNYYALTSLAGLENLTSVVELISIRYNTQLNSLTGLEKLTSLGERGSLQILNNANLTSLAGLENLTTVGGALEIWSDANLTSLAGLKNLTSVGNFTIYSNGRLNNLTGLEKLNSISSLTISGNPQLSQCCLLQSVIQAAKGNVYLSNNAANCNSLAEVEATCTPSITSQPQTTTLCSGEKATFRVEAIGINLKYQWQKDGVNLDGAISPTYSIEAVSPEDEGAYSVILTNKNTSLTSESATLTVKSSLVLGAFTAPTAPVAVNTSFNVSVPFSGSTVNSATWNWGDGSTSPAALNNSTISGNHKYTKAGTYSPILTVTDACGQATSTTYEYVVVYESGAITGAGGFASPKQAYKADFKLTGSAVFGLYARYKKGTSLPEGSTLFAFQAGKVKMAFASTSYETLTVAGTKARYTGKGKLNGQGNYGFLVSLIDGRPDKFRIKIWNKDKGNQVIYDNNLTSTTDAADPATAIVGFITIQISKAAVARLSLPGAEVAMEETHAPVFKNYPNPFAEKTTLEFTFEQDQDYTLAIYDLSGKLVSQLPSGKAKAGEKVQVEWQAAPYPKGVYLARLRAATSVQHLKLVVE
ncbi:T9SS type A sorting domain-containing protein [Adhaeribacter arboris]|nr:T9SS type A sorting domain-containing protein [Adhaeribacter arboris]